ncbi:MAG: type II toxin-antitoxin system VapC family toxin [Cyanobacterium sp. T60_A2020_053]|nr:type II toxin-antitoxin system VapC family toxin [Cyanobacterium sp. T60_A2020_053]
MSQMIILDTHIWFWFINQEFKRFPDHWRELIETTPDVAVSCVSCFEIALAYQKNRINLPCSPSQWFTASLKPVDIQLLPLTPEIANLAVNLSPVHKDPFDRIIIATVIEYQAKLASVDSLFSQYIELDKHFLQK